jgi:LacI family transcriptional regulator
MSEDGKPQPSREPPSQPRVGLLIASQVGAGRDILTGIARYVRENSPWALHLELRTQLFVQGWAPKWLERWQGQGIIARFETQHMMHAVERANVPAVDVLGILPNCPFPRVLVDDNAISVVAAEHLLQRGFRQFGFVARPDQSWSDRRMQAFQRAVAKHGHECVVLPAGDRDALPETWDQFIDDAAAWIKKQPKPFGLMLCYDRFGPPMLQACRRAGVTVPEEVAIIGVDNEEVICALCDPPLASVAANHDHVGYQAAALLHRLMNGEPCSTEPIYVQPRGVVVRQSSDIAAVEDPVVSTALSIIREQSCNGLQVKDVVERVPLSHSVLQKRFRAALGRSVHEEIVRVQLAKAQELLRETSLPIRTVAERAGFKHQEYMGAVFRARLNVTPRQFRRRHQGAR